MSAGNITVNPELLKNADLLAIKKEQNDGESDAKIMEELNKLQSEKIFAGGTGSYFLESIVSDMSIDSQKAVNLYKNYTDLKTSIHNQRLSIMGVDTDEEAMDMIKYQQAYNLNSKMMSVMNQIYDKLINQTGI
jgi:flagellar hook-associated protein 1 FlgK